MTTSQTDPVQRNEAQETPNERPSGDREPDPIDGSIDESMAEADRANGEGAPDDATEIHRNGESDEAEPT